MEVDGIMVSTTEDRFVIKWNIDDNLSTGLGDTDNPYSADIRVRGRWHLDTGHEDGVIFSIDQKFLFGVFVYEIDGREPDPNIDVPLFGGGKIPEPLILELRP